jgi:superfamily II DNA or RNA helicase
MVEVTDFHQKVLRRTSSPKEFKVYRAGLEWDLTEPIVIESAEDFKSAPKWKDRLTPYYHQVTNLITFCRRLPVTLLADDVGLGKTISAGLVISELASRSRVSKVLVVCPKILGPQWQSELTTKFDIPAKFVTGREVLTADFEEFGVVITTYNSARLYLEDIPEDRFQMLVLDEAHKLRNLYGVENPPKVAKCFHAALQKRRFSFVLMLTATPIHNRLWDLYSLVDLLTVGRGHQNPFGSPGLFARKYIADDRDTARRLRTEAIKEFRDVVYGYMSRVRRGDAKLHFPDRIVKRHQVDPTPAELALIDTIAEPIQGLNRLSQISILKALASSPEALNSQLKNMARNGTVPAVLSQSVNAIVEKMPTTAKLKGLGQLIEHLKKQSADKWRLVVFTTSRETQTSIQIFLENCGFKIGIINGDSGQRNQETIERFRANPPEYRIIVSTEAGAEGVNLQAANVLVNFDLPWNPMVVEQRIGRIQRLASEYANVVVYNITLRGTFEEYIVGRLVEKLQMASNAIGDVESLLQGADESDDEEDEKFEERLLQLVLRALAAKDKKRAVDLEVASIEEAIDALERERKNIDDLLGEGEDGGYVGPRAPTLPPALRSMSVKDFTLQALETRGIRVSSNPPDLYAIEENGNRYYIRFEEASTANVKSILYNEGSNSFHRLVDQVTATALHRVEDFDNNPEQKNSEIVRRWVESFGGSPTKIEIETVNRKFEGRALVRVRATILHDSYERLVEIKCSPHEHTFNDGRPALRTLTPIITDVAETGLNMERVADAASLDEGIAEFSRFYFERREQEVRFAGDDDRKKRRLYDEFTPRFEATVVALEGTVHREICARAQFDIDDGTNYESSIVAVPSTGEVCTSPAFDLCTQTGRKVPKTCLARCQISGAVVLRHLLKESEHSGRMVLPEHIEVCSLTNKRVARDELAVSDVSGQRVIGSVLLPSEISGKRAEPNHFACCAFTGAKALRTELSESSFSGKLYRIDQEAISECSGKRGHHSEFIHCFETRQLIGTVEAEKCQETGELVRPDVLVRCEVTGKKVLPSVCGRCAVTNKLALKHALVSSSISQAPIIQDAAIQSTSGNFCLPAECGTCAWTGQKFHPDDLKNCSLTRLLVHSDFLTEQNSRLQPLFELLNDVNRLSDGKKYPVIERALARKMNGARCKVVSGAISPTSNSLAVCAEIKHLLGLKTNHIGFVLSPVTKEIVGKVTQGKRTKHGWFEI